MRFRLNPCPVPPSCRHSLLWLFSCSSTTSFLKKLAFLQQAGEHDTEAVVKTCILIYKPKVEWGEEEWGEGAEGGKEEEGREKKEEEREGEERKEEEGREEGEGGGRGRGKGKTRE